MRALYMAVDLEKNELPLFVSTSATEVADWAGVPVVNVLSAISHAETRGTRSRFVRIRLDDDDEVFREEDEHTVKGFELIGEYIGVTKTTVRSHRDELPLTRIGNRWQAEKDDLDAWMKDPPEWYAKIMRRKRDEIDRR